MISSVSMDLLKSIIIGLFLYLVFRFILKMNNYNSETLSIIVACVSCIYLLIVNISSK